MYAMCLSIYLSIYLSKIFRISVLNLTDGTVKAGMRVGFSRRFNQVLECFERQEQEIEDEEEELFLLGG